MQPEQTDKTPAAATDNSDSSAPQSPPQFITGSQMHNDLTKPKADNKKTSLLIIVVILLIFAILGILFYAKII